MDPRMTTVEINRFTAGQNETIKDQVVKEVPATIFFNDREIVTLLCTPEYLEDLAVGFLASEGMLKKAEELNEVKVDYESGTIWVKTAKDRIIAEKLFLKRYITTGCGKGTSFYDAMDAQLAKPIVTDLKINIQEISGLVQALQHQSQLFKETGGVHGCALADRGGIAIFREDIGRHNATDKILGKCFREGIPLNNKFFLTSGRVSSEILIKTAKMGIPILVSHSAPTELAIKLAQELGVTIIGFARGKRFNVYTYPERVQA